MPHFFFVFVSCVCWSFCGRLFRLPLAWSAQMETNNILLFFYNGFNLADIRAPVFSIVSLPILQGIHYASFNLLKPDGCGIIFLLCVYNIYVLIQFVPFRCFQCTQFLTHSNNIFISYSSLLVANFVQYALINFIVNVFILCVFFFLSTKRFNTLQK